MLATIGAAIAPGVALLSYFYLRDKYETEPIHMVIKTFIFGLLLVFPIFVFQKALLDEYDFGAAGKAFLIAGTIEEFFKWFVVYHMAYKHVEFDEPYDGIIYSVSVSLGFATLENFFYLKEYGLDNALLRALLPVSGHALFAVTMGYYLGKGKFKKKRNVKVKYLLFSLALPILLHGTYDYIILIGGSQWLWFMIPFMAFLWIHSLLRISKLSKIPPFYTQ